MSFTLDRLQRSVPIVDGNGLPSAQFQMLWQRTVEQIEAAVASIVDVNDQQQELLDQIATILGLTDDLNAAVELAQAAADTASSAAADAQAAADSAGASGSLATSGVVDCAIVGSDDGVNARVDISAHTRVYGDGATVAVSAGFLIGLDFDTVYYVYYSDPTRAGGAVSYLVSQDAVDASQTGDIHSVGTIVTPSDGGPDTTGQVNMPPGVV